MKDIPSHFQTPQRPQKTFLCHGLLFSHMTRVHVSLSLWSNVSKFNYRSTFSKWPCLCLSDQILAELLSASTFHKSQGLLFCCVFSTRIQVMLKVGWLMFRGELTLCYRCLRSTRTLAWRTHSHWWKTCSVFLTSGNSDAKLFSLVIVLHLKLIFLTTILKRATLFKHRKNCETALFEVWIVEHVFCRKEGRLRLLRLLV